MLSSEKIRGLWLSQCILIYDQGPFLQTSINFDRGIDKSLHPL